MRLISKLAIAGSVTAVALITGLTISTAIATPVETLTIQDATSCAWAASDQESAVIVRLDGSDCQTAFQAISSMGLNWESVGPGWDSGQLECSLVSGGRTMRVYEIDYVPYPLMTYGNDVCSAAEQDGWLPN